MNAQTRQLRKLGLCCKTVRGPHTGTKQVPTISKVNHGPHAFQEAATAVKRKKELGVRSWRVTGKHPGHRKVED